MRRLADASSNDLVAAAGLRRAKPKAPIGVTLRLPTAGEIGAARSRRVSGEGLGARIGQRRTPMRRLLSELSVPLRLSLRNIDKALLVDDADLRSADFNYVS